MIKQILKKYWIIALFEFIVIIASTLINSNINAIALLVFPIIISARIFETIRANKNLSKQEFIEIIVGQIILLILPYIIVSIILPIFNNSLNLLDCAKWFGVNALFILVLSSISNFVGSISKNSNNQIIGNYAILYLPIGLVYLVGLTLKNYVCGLVSIPNCIYALITNMPGVKMIFSFMYNYNTNSYFANINILQIIIDILLSICLLILSYKIYNKEKKYIVKVLKWIATFITTFVVALLVVISGNSLTNGIIASIIISVIVYCTISLAEKERNKKMNIIKICIYEVIILGMFLLIYFDVFNYERKIPSIENIEYATFSNVSPLENRLEINFKNRENIEFIMQKQKEAIDSKNKKVNLKDKEYRTYYIQYKLNDGTLIERAYKLEVNYYDIYKTNEYLEQRYSYIIDSQENELSQISVIGIYNDVAFYIPLNSEEELYKTVIELAREDINKIYKQEDYGVYGKNDGLQYLVLDVINKTGEKMQGYMEYSNINNNYKLVELVNKLIEEENEKIIWYSE